MGKLIDADALERNGWTMTRIVQVDANTMEYQTKKPTEFQTIGTQQWIPCSEALPDNEDYVFCTTETKKGLRQVVRGYYMHDVKDWACGMNRNVLAWAPMPEPYKGGTR